MGEDNTDGHTCINAKEWGEFKQDFTKVTRIVREVHVGMRALQRHAKHLEDLQELRAQTHTLREIKEGLLAAATGENRLPVDSVKEMFKEVAKSRLASDRIFAVTILALVGIVTFLLVGERFGWIRELVKVVN